MVLRRGTVIAVLKFVVQNVDLEVVWLWNVNLS